MKLRERSVVEAVAENVYNTVTSRTLTYQQKLIKLSDSPDRMLEVTPLNPEILPYIEAKAVNGMGEGNAAYKPRYVCPDYQLLMDKGSKFLNLEPPKTLLEAVNALLIMYKHVPSVIVYPVYLGNIDYLLDPFITDENEEEARAIIKMFLTTLDRTLHSSYSHANLGPKATRAGRIILQLERELCHEVPGLSLKYDPDITSDDFAVEAIKTGLACAKPSFANDKWYRENLDPNYNICSCYNTLGIGGGAYTLSRLNLKNLADMCETVDEFFDDKLPELVRLTAEMMEDSMNFMVEDSAILEDWLYKEGFVDQKRCVSMFGVLGLAEASNYLASLEGATGRFGSDKQVDDMGERILSELDRLVKEYKVKYCDIADNHFLMHAQVGVSSDVDVTPASRIPIGEEPELPIHLAQASRYHKYFVAGAGDIFPFDTTVHKNPAYILDVIKGAFESGMNYISIYSQDSDVIRITGYLVKRSEIEKLERGDIVMHDTVYNGQGMKQFGKVLERKLQK